MPAVEARGLSKMFIVSRNPAENLKVRFVGLFDPRQRERREELRALRGVDLSVGSGGCLGFIGPNGSGKSTLLRLMAGIFPPTDGTLRVEGRVAPMIELARFPPRPHGMRERLPQHFLVRPASERDGSAL